MVINLALASLANSCLPNTNPARLWPYQEDYLAYAQGRKWQLIAHDQRDATYHVNLPEDACVFNNACATDSPIATTMLA